MLLGRADLARVGGWSHSSRHVDTDLLARIRSAGGLVYRTHAMEYVYVRRDTGAVDTSQRHNVTAANLADAGARVPDDPGLVADGDRIRMSAELRAALAERFRPDLDALRASWPRFPGWDLDRETGRAPADGGS